MSVSRNNLIWCGLAVSVAVCICSSGSPPNGVSGAPPNMFTCASICHTGSTSMAGTVDILGMPASVSPSTTYPIQIRLIKTDGANGRGGFELTAVEGAEGDGVGIWSNLGPAVTISTAGNRQYLKHLSDQNMPFIAGFPDTVTYTADWTSPVVINDNTFMYAAGNISNGIDGRLGDRIVTTSVSDLPLPVDLIDFSVQKDGNDLQLFWKTASEEHSNRFEIQRSDRSNKYITIGTVNAMGESTDMQFYTFVDEDALRNQVSFYRLKMIDRDEKFHYSHILSYRDITEQKYHIAAFPNPLAKGQCLTIDFDSPQDFESIEMGIYNTSGQRVFDDPQFEDPVFIGLNKYVIDPSSLQEGLYYLVLRKNNLFRESTPFIIMQ